MENLCPDLNLLTRQFTSTDLCSSGLNDGNENENQIQTEAEENTLIIVWTD